MLSITIRFILCGVFSIFTWLIIPLSIFNYFCVPADIPKDILWATHMIITFMLAYVVAIPRWIEYFKEWK